MGFMEKFFGIRKNRRVLPETEQDSKECTSSVFPLCRRHGRVQFPEFSFISAKGSISFEFTGKNLYNGKWKACYLKTGSLKEFGKAAGTYRTTHWFGLEEGQKFLTMSGDAFNRAVWQFKDQNGMLLGDTEKGKPEKYRVVNQKQFDRSCAKVKIPEQAVSARVYFAKTDEQDCAPLGNELQIQYGLIPEYYEAYYRKILKFELSEKHEKIVFESKKWKVYSEEGTLISEGALDLDWDKVEQIKLICCASEKVTCVWTEVSNESIGGEYGIRWRLDSPIPICERIGDAAGLHFNYMIDDDWAGVHENDFDSVYPWNSIRTCAVRVSDTGVRSITYEGEHGFATDGSCGEMMVEIPLFYSKREQKEGYEFLWISGEPKTGYELDPSFQSEDGVLEHIYVGAYLASEEGKEVHSKRDSFVSLKRSMREYREMVDQAHGYEAYDLLMHLTVQRLFLVETALMDSQAVFEGIVYLPYKVVNTKTAYYALETQKKTNEIIVKNTPITRRLLEGDCVTVLKYWNEYKNTPSFQRQIKEVTALEGNRLKLCFDGPAMNVEKEKTGISALPRKNGETDCLSYHTARGSRNQKQARGHESFRYRGIENLWGGAWIILGNCYVCDNFLYLKYPDGTEHKISYELPVQNVILTSKQFGSPEHMCVKKMGYDQEHPLVMFPEEIGNGASTNTYYCDAWYNIAEPGVKYLVTYGGAWDNLGYAGIFCYRANYVEEDKIPFNGLRIMLR